ncbi:MAG: flagellar export chaperone FlgN [Melioribacter sp.]|uniref:flagellar export chaperone FlgN n=1 Tax=Rosettibacter primus TaxID=3111523 RepID=UPI00247D30AA|nr:flagellar export chaperone FlgN [Melioribacter sp.]
MKIEELTDSIERQKKNFDDLLEVVKIKKEALLKNDMSLLDKAVDDEQKLLSAITKEEKERKKLTFEYAKENSIQLKNGSIEELINSLPNKNLDRIKEKRDAIKSRAAEIIKLNSHITVLVNVSRNIIRDTILTVFGKGENNIVNKRV